MSKIIFEACVDSLDAAIEAERAGANRIELCSALEIGGVTPSYGLIKTVLEKLTIPVNVLIRPRGGNFVYSDYEFEAMKHDVVFCRENNISGIVVGILLPDFTIDKERTHELINIAQPMSITFNRAFDETSDPLDALDTLIELKVDRLLTSGQEPDAFTGRYTIKKLVDRAKEKIIIMPGGGINENNIAEIISYTGVKEIHGSARIKSDRNDYYTFSKERLYAILNGIKNL